MTRTDEIRSMLSFPLVQWPEEEIRNSSESETLLNSQLLFSQLYNKLIKSSLQKLAAVQMHISFSPPKSASAPESETAAFRKRTLEVWFLFDHKIMGDHVVQQ